MGALLEFLRALPEEQLWLVGGVVASVLLQVIKRWVWRPADDAKAAKVLAAIIIAGLVAAAGAPETWPAFCAAWLATFLAALGYHEVTDKLGLKALWATTVEGGGE